jgi:hypothetical protein
MGMHGVWHTTVTAAIGLALAVAATTSAFAQVRSVPVPAPDGSGMYSLASSADGRVYLSWIEPQGVGHALKFSRLEGDAWSAPQIVARGADWFVNWAYHPSVVPLNDGGLVAHWLVKVASPTSQAKGTYGYGLRIAHSRDAGRTWRTVFEAGPEDTSDYAGFVSFAPTASGFLAAYLTPPSFTQLAPAKTTNTTSATTATAHGGGGEHIKTLRVARFDREGTLLSDDPVDVDTCSCCVTSIVETADGPLVAYRDHQQAIRDISVARYRGGRWTTPATVHADGWEINGCPTNGPALSAAARRVAIAWFTAAGDRPHVKLAFSTNAGERFSAPVTIDGGQPVGWPGVALLESGAAVVSWLERRADNTGEIRVRQVSRDGRLGAPVIVATTQPGRTTGVPQMVRVGSSLIVAWRADRVMSAIVPVSALEAVEATR